MRRLSALYFNDWTSSYSSPTTPLANRFVEEFDNALLSVKPKDRGFTEITAIQNSAWKLYRLQLLRKPTRHFQSHTRK